MIKESTKHHISAFWVKIDRDWIGQGSCKLAFPIVSEPPHSHEFPLGIRQEFKNIFFRPQIICFHPKTIGTNGDPSILILIFTFAPNQIKSSAQPGYPQTWKDRIGQGTEEQILSKRNGCNELCSTLGVKPADQERRLKTRKKEC